MNKRKLLNILILLMLVVTITGCGKVETVRKRISKYLYEKYGEEFEVYDIGIRTAYESKFYQAHIYPKSKIDENGIKDYYYEASASIDIGPFGILEKGVGDSYWLQKRNDKLEEYLLPKAKEIFGERIRLKTSSEYEKTVELGERSFYYGLKEVDLDKILKEFRADTEGYVRFKVTLYIYIFDRIDNEEEKEKRRQEIFDYINYLKKKGLFEYLEMGVIFVDERVLAPSYWKYKPQVMYGNKVEERIEGELVKLPPKELREEMSKILGKEVSKMTEEEILKKIKKIKKEELSYEELRKYNSQYQTWIYSKGMLEAEYNSSYEKDKKNGKLDFYEYKFLKNINLLENLEYIY